MTAEGARRDYGVVVREVDAELAGWEVDEEATRRERAEVKEKRVGWLAEDPEALAERYRNEKLGTVELIRRYGELLPRTTGGFRVMFRRRAVPH